MAHGHARRSAMKNTKLFAGVLCCWLLASGMARADESDMAVPPRMPPAVPEVLAQRMGMMAEPLSVSEIDVLFLYTPDTLRAYGSVNGVQNRINTLVSYANTAYGNSGVNLHINNAGQQLVQYDNSNITSTAFNHLANKTHFAFAAVNQKRMAVQADIVVLVRPQKADTAVCGKAYVNGIGLAGLPASFWSMGGYAYAHVYINCASFVLAHELGHIMGLVHSRTGAAPTAGAYAYGAGYKVSNDFSTIMAGTPATIPVPYFSSPAHQCTGSSGIPKPCGLDSSLANGADAVLALNNIAAQTALFSQDSDDDGMPDWFEHFWGLDRYDASDAVMDLDGDGLSNIKEFYAESYAGAWTDGTNTITLAQARDTDGDGILDGADVYPTIVGTPLVIFGLDGTYRGGKIEERIQSD